MTDRQRVSETDRQTDRVRERHTHTQAKKGEGSEAKLTASVLN